MYQVRRPRGSGNWLLTYTLDGRGLYRGPVPDLFAGPGDIVLLGPRRPSRLRPATGWSWEFLGPHFQPRLEWFEWWNPLLGGEGPGLSHLREPLEPGSGARRSFLRLRAGRPGHGRPLARAGAQRAGGGAVLLAVRKGPVGVPSTRGCGRSWISSPQTSPPIMTCLVSRGRSRSRHRGYLTSSRRRSAESVIGALIRLRLKPGRQASGTYGRRRRRHRLEGVVWAPHTTSAGNSAGTGMSPRQYRATAGHVRSGSDPYPASSFLVGGE